jgi:two-component system, OmpR family, sensor histidine kinase KdpD
MSNIRPTAKKLLRDLSQEELSNSKGHLKIYIGMAAGVGKTYSMLSDAILEERRGNDVLIGYVESHKRPETAALTELLDKIPTKNIDIAGNIFQEFNLDAALERHPKIILVDELAHTNAPGSRHPKRWQDVEELINAGINVYTTVNIQHLESLKDIVAQITGITVQETVPDSVLAEAHEVVVVDLPPGELIKRINEGKVYNPEQAKIALNNFFREGNLIALRELVLRRTAERVDLQMKRYRMQHSIDNIWPTNTRVMVCVGPSPMAKMLVRAAHRLAVSMHAELVALNLAGSHFLMLPENQRLHATQALQLAESLGARTILRAGQDMVTEILDVANSENISAIVIGKSVRPRWRNFLSRSLVDELIRQSSGISIHVISTRNSNAVFYRAIKTNNTLKITPFLIAIGIVVLCTAVCWISFPFLELSNLCMIYLLGVAYVSSFFSWREAITASFFSVLSFDYFFVNPRFSFSVNDSQYLITFFVMLVISLLISSLSLRNRSQTLLISEREKRTSSLYELSRILLAAPSIDSVVNAIQEHTNVLFKCSTSLILLHPDFKYTPICTKDPFNNPNELAVAKWAFENKSSAGIGTSTLPGAIGLYIPICSGANSIAVLALSPKQPLDYDQNSLLDAIVNQITLALERILLEIESNKSEMLAESERLRATLLSSISHDLRTPLAVIAGSASALLERHNLSSENQKELSQSIWDESQRLTRIVRNVLDLTRLETHSIKIKKEWHSIEELIGSALVRTSHLLKCRQISINIPSDIPLIEMDGYLFEQLIINLLENVSKHTSINTAVEITAKLENSAFILNICDNGPGLKQGDEELIFKKLYSSTTLNNQGFGLGLTICKAIMLAHSGDIKASNRPNGGAQFTITLPQASPPPEIPNDRQ